MTGKIQRRGSMMMEFVLIMPVLMLLIFGIVQFAQIWIARLMTYYAAYCAARTAIVYHPNDCTGLPNTPVHNAACVALAWIGMTTGGNQITIPGWGGIPTSGHIQEQVTVQVEDLLDTKNIPAVKATVRFEFPLLVPLAGEIIGYFHAGGQAQGNWDVVGFTPNDITEKTAGLKRGWHPYGNGGNIMTLTESCILPRPWSTASFPRADATAYSLDFGALLGGGAQ